MYNLFSVNYPVAHMYYCEYQSLEYVDPSYYKYEKQPNKLKKQVGMVGPKKYMNKKSYLTRCISTFNFCSNSFCVAFF